MSVISFRHLHNVSTIGSGSVKFKVYAPYQLPQLATPQNVSASGTTVSWGAVENATSYEVFADGTSIATTANVSYNLTNSAGWTSLSDGNHNITIVAKADGYRDSEHSSAVVVTKSTTPTEDELAGTWVFNETLNLSAETLPEEVIAELGWVDIPITADDGTEYYGLLFGSLNGELNEFTSLLYGETEVYNGMWNKESDRIITINALLEKVRNGQSLLEFLQANGTKQGSATLISFTIDRSSIWSDSISYQAEEGMTWAQWVESSYNTGGYMNVGTWIGDQFGNSVAIRSGKFVTDVSPSDTIQASTVYVLKSSGSGQ